MGEHAGHEPDRADGVAHVDAAAAWYQRPTSTKGPSAVTAAQRASIVVRRWYPNGSCRRADWTTGPTRVHHAGGGVSPACENVAGHRCAGSNPAEGTLPLSYRPPYSQVIGTWGGCSTLRGLRGVSALCLRR